MYIYYISIYRVFRFISCVFRFVSSAVPGLSRMGRESKKKKKKKKRGEGLGGWRGVVIVSRLAIESSRRRRWDRAIGARVSAPAAPSHRRSFRERTKLPPKMQKNKSYEWTSVEGNDRVGSPRSRARYEDSIASHESRWGRENEDAAGRSLVFIHPCYARERQSVGQSVTHLSASGIKDHFSSKPSASPWTPRWFSARVATRDATRLTPYKKTPCRVNFREAESYNIHITLYNYIIHVKLVISVVKLSVGVSYVFLPISCCSGGFFNLFFLSFFFFFTRDILSCVTLATYR